MTIDIQPEDREIFDRIPSSGRINNALRRLITQQRNVCSICDHFILPYRPAFAGYTADGSAAYVGACCGAQLVQLATPVYWKSNLDLSVSGSQKIWRYMDFAKFTALIAQRGLYLPRADSFEDPFEGAAGIASRREEWDQHYRAFFKTAMLTPPNGESPTAISEEVLEEQSSRLLRELEGAASEARSRLVSCWHANDGESEALWRLYSPPPTTGVAVQSTVDQLWDVFAEHPAGVVGKVQYLDYNRAFAGINDRIFCKRRSLSHEREVRAVLPNSYALPVSGALIPCNLTDLISRVVVSPFAPSWFSSILEQTMSRFDLAIPVSSSELLEQPFF